MKNNLNGKTLKREIGLFSSISIVVANMVGTGIFTTSGFIIEELADPAAMLLCWFIGGLFALSGALCYGELGARLPKAGGEYAYLKASFGGCLGFLSGWISLIVGFSAPIAASSIAFSTYAFQALGLGSGAEKQDAVFTLARLNLSAQSLIAVFIILGFSLLHYHSLKIGTRIQNCLTVFKISIIFVFILTGFLSGNGQTEHFISEFSLSSLFQENFAISLIFVSFAYSGWNAAAYLGAEIKQPDRTIPIALFTGTCFVMCLYLLLNCIYLYALPPYQMGGSVDVGHKAAVSLFGYHIGRYFSALIAAGLLSVISAMIMAGPRVYYAMSRDGLFFKPFGSVNAATGTPALSIFLQGIIAVIMVITSSFELLLIYIGFTLSLVAIMTVIGLMKIRSTSNHNTSRYSTVGYPFTPLFFITGNAWVLFFSIKSKPIPSLLGLVTILTGIGLYFYFNRNKEISN